jgi:YVTN family beta-propeller protein
MKKSYSIFMLWAMVAFMGSACDTDNDNTSGLYQNGVFIVNEGPFNSGTGTISFLDRHSKTVTNSIFSKINDRPLGNIVQSLNFHNDKGYVVINNANKVEVVEKGTFKSIATIEGLPFPRHFLGIDQGKAYISCWGGSHGEVKVVDLSSHSVVKTIAVHTGPDAMAKIGNKVFVVNGGGFGSDNKISVIDVTTDQVIETIVVDDNPNSIRADAQGKLWILCGGKKTYDAITWDIIVEQSSKPAILQLDPTNYSILKRLEFGNIFESPSSLAINSDGTTLFYLLGFGVAQLNTTDNQLPAQPIIEASFYGLGYDPATEYLYAADAGDYSSAGKVIRFMSTGVPVDTFSVGVIPNGFYFD